MQRVLSLFCLFILMILGFINIAYGQIYYKVPSTDLYMEAPDGFHLSKNFTGFSNEKTGASIMVLNLPEANKNMRELYGDREKIVKVMKEQNYYITDDFDTQAGDAGHAHVYFGTQTANNLDYNKGKNFSL